MEDGQGSCEVFSGHHMTISLMNSQQLWLLEKEQDESGPQQKALITRLQKKLQMKIKGTLPGGE